MSFIILQMTSVVVGCALFLIHSFNVNKKVDIIIEETEELRSKLTKTLYDNDVLREEVDRLETVLSEITKVINDVKYNGLS